LDDKDYGPGHYLKNCTILKLFILLLLASTVSVKADELTSLPCSQKILNTLFNPPIPSLSKLAKENVLPLQLFEGEINENLQSFALSESKFYDPKSVYIGVTNAPMQIDIGGGTHHYYLYAGGNKVHMGIDGTIQIGAKKANQPIRVFQGTIFKLQTDDILTQKIITSARELEGKKVANCMQGICEILKNADVRIGKTGDQFIATPRVMAAGLLSGDVTHAGAKIPMEMLVSSKYEMTSYISRANWAERRRKGTLSFVVLATGGSVIWYLVKTPDAAAPTPLPSPSPHR